MHDMKPGRNDPCTCGSGKKYKHCCLRAESAAVETPEEFLRRRVRALIDGLTEQLLRFAGTRLGVGLIDEAWADFTLGQEETFDPASPHLPVFMSWFLHQWFPDPDDTRFPDLAARKATIAAEFLAHKRRHLEPLLVRYLEACAAAPFSFHEVVRVEPGRGFTLRDLLLERETFVSEHSGSLHAQPADILFAQIVALDGLALIEGWGPLVIQPGEKPAIIELRKTLRGKGDLCDAALLRELSIELIGLYLATAERKLHPAMPELQNTDGEPVELRTLVFRIDNSEAAAASLDAAQLTDGEELVQDEASRGPDGKLIEAGWTWKRAGNAIHKSWDNTTLGQIALAGRQLKVNVNSAARAVRAKALIERLLAGNASYRATKIASTEAMLADVRSRPAHKDDNEHERLMQMPEVRQQVAEMLMRHYTDWLGTKVPLLGERTPREAVRDRDGREAVAALIVQIERDGGGQSPPLDPEIPAMLRRELGLG
jgi:SEC-C motif-containing protein